MSRTKEAALFTTVFLGAILSVLATVAGIVYLATIGHPVLAVVATVALLWTCLFLLARFS